MNNSKGEVIRQVTSDYLATIDVDNPPSPAEIQGDIIKNMGDAFDLENALLPKGRKWHCPDELAPSQIADIIRTLYPVANISCAGSNTDASYDILGIYQYDGDNEGIYVSDDLSWAQLIRQFRYTINRREIEEVKAAIHDNAPRLTRCMEKHLIAVNNGIFDYDKKELLPFSPDKVFIAKCKVDYNPNAKNVVIHNALDGTDWDVESWMNTLSDDKEIVNTLWEVIGAIIRPNVPWGRSAWFYSETGNNGKGTLCELMRAITGEGSYASISLSDMAKDFMLEPLIHASAIIVDENDVGIYIDRAANLKAIITNDVLQMNRKFKTPIAFQFKGFMVQCLNEMPKIKDKSDSFYRRQLFIPFTKCFTGRERKYIKQDYLHRKDVLEYVLYKVLNMNYYQLSVPEACKAALEDYKEYNDPVRQFVDEILPECRWDLLPFTFLYDLYKAWYERNIGKTGLQGRNTFIDNLLNVIKDSTEWSCLDKKARITSKGLMDAPEPLILEYNLEHWQNSRYIGSKDRDKAATPDNLKKEYRGLQRLVDVD